MSSLELRYNFVKTIKLASDINSCSFNNFNTLAIGTSDKTVSVWEWTEEGFKEANYSPLLYHNYAITSVVFSPDGLVLASSSMDGMTYLFNSKTGGVRASIVQSIGGGVRESAISPTDGQLLGTVTDEGYIFLWNLESYQIMRYWLGHEACISCLAFSLDSYLLVTGDMDGTCKVWLVDRAISSLCMVDTLCGHVHKDSHDGGILTVAFSPNHYTEMVTRDYQMCSGGDDNLLRLWEVSTEVLGAKERKRPKVTVKFLKVLDGHLSSVTCARYSSDGCYIGSTSLDGSARIWEVTSGACVRVLGGHRHSVFCCAFSPELAFFSSGSNDKTVNLWQLTNRPIPVIVQIPNQNDEDFEEKALERRYFTIFDNLRPGANVNSVDFNNNFDLVVGCSDKIVRQFVRKGSEFEDKVCKKPMKAHDYAVVNVEFSRCGRYLVTGSIDGAVIVWNYCTGEIIHGPFQLSSQGGRAARFSPTSDWVALGGSDGKAYLWSMKKQAVKFSYPGHIEAINCLAFSPDGEYLATGCTAGQVKLWKANPAISLCQLLLENVHDLGVMSCDFSNAYTKMKGSAMRVYRLATGGNDSLVKVFKLWPVDELIVKAEEIFCMRGHGGSITEVRFSGKSTDVLASTAIDRTARIWNMQNGQCLNVLTHHKSQVTCCAFSPDSTLFATGSLDSSVIVWKVPKVICMNNKYEVVELPQKLVNPGEALDLIALKIDDVQVSIDDLLTAAKRNSLEIPDHFLCPITQQLMTEPVICEDGFTYENHAIQAWMVNGRSTSPMTNVPLSSTVVVPNVVLKKEIKTFLVNSLEEDDSSPGTSDRA